MPIVLPSFAGTVAPASASFNPNALSASLDGSNEYVGIAGLASRSLGALSMWVNITSANGITLAERKSTKWVCLQGLAHILAAQADTTD